MTHVGVRFRATVPLTDTGAVIDDAAGISAALRGTVLEDYPVDEGENGTFVIAIVGDEVEQAWRAARGAVSVTGRRPVAVIHEDELPEADEAVLAQFDALARTIDPWPYFVHQLDDEPVGAAELSAATTGWLKVDLAPEMAQELALPTTWPVAERWIYDKMLAQPTLATLVRGHVEHLTGTKTWFTPRGAVDLVLLPTASPWLTPVWLTYFGADSPPGSEALAAVIWQWQQQYEAELVAWWGTMLQFVVRRPPVPGEPAWKLAGQLLAVGSSLSLPRWLLALAVASSDALVPA